MRQGMIRTATIADGLYGFEDSVLKDELSRKIVQDFIRRIETR